MSPYTKKLFVKKWLPILEEYEKVRAKKSSHFRKVKDLLSAHRVVRKEFYRHYHRWIEANRNIDAILPQKQGPKYKTRRTLKPIERNIMKAYRKLGAPSYEIVELFKPYYGEQTPSSRTIDRIKARYPLNEKQKKQIKRYEKRYPGELGHVDTYYLPLEVSQNRKYLAALEDDCTRLSYTEVIDNLKGFTLGCFMYRSFHWFKKVYVIPS